jgi:CheY-like chemotaxis protein
MWTDRRIDGCAIKQLLANRHGRDVPWGWGSRRRMRRPRIVIADNDRDQLKVLKAILEDDARTRDLAIIVVSGDAPTLRAQAEWFRSDGVAVLEKPYELDELLALVRERIDAATLVGGP